MRTDRVLPLLSSSDHTFEYQGQPAADRLADLLTGLGVTSLADVPVISNDEQGACGHSDYFMPERPACGWSAASTALRTAFED